MTTSKQNAVHKADVKVGSTYAVKVSGRIVPVTIDSIRQVNLYNGQGREVTQWSGLNQQTGNRVTIRSAAKLRYELVRDIGLVDGQPVTPTNAAIALNQEAALKPEIAVQYKRAAMRSGRWVRKDSPVVFELVSSDRPEHLTGGAYFDPDPNCGFCLGLGSVDSGGSTPWGESIDVACGCLRIRRDVTPDELRSLCGEDAPEQCQEFEDESGRWRRV